MYGLDTLKALNIEATIRGILGRAALNGITLTREEILEELDFEDGEDTSVWGATVDRLMEIQS